MWLSWQVNCELWSTSQLSLRCNIAKSLCKQTSKFTPGNGALSSCFCNGAVLLATEYPSTHQSIIKTLVELKEKCFKNSKLNHELWSFSSPNWIEMCSKSDWCKLWNPGMNNSVTFSKVCFLLKILENKDHLLENNSSHRTRCQFNNSQVLDGGCTNGCWEGGGAKHRKSNQIHRITFLCSCIHVHYKHAWKFHSRSEILFDDEIDSQVNVWVFFLLSSTQFSYKRIFAHGRVLAKYLFQWKYLQLDNVM